MSIEPDLVAVLTVVALALVVLLAIVVLILALRLRVVRRTQKRVFGRGERDVVTLLDEHRAELAALWGEIRELQGGVTAMAETQRGATSRVAVLRYDAFDDMGGALSFSAALLDDRGDGMVLSAINGRSETRSYAKQIVGGDSEADLTGEEREVVSAAMEDRPATQPPPRRRRRRAS
ncbi:MAG: DUF4446 family protein [Nitriliruptoraceae bacterium]|nr:DUF4446 family protein [Nitriliruptoraceae bacterium]